LEKEDDMKSFFSRKNIYHLRTLRVLLLPILFLALIGVACPFSGLGMPRPVTPSTGDSVNLPPTQKPGEIFPTEPAQVGPCRFSAAGNAVYGWYWLRDKDYAALGQWDCRGLPVDQDLPVSLQTLVTNQVDGGSGYSSPVKITYTNPTSQESQTIQVYLQNPFAAQSPENSRGVGYPTTGYFIVPRAYLDANGGLLVRLERFQPNTFHVAVNASSLNFDRPRYADSFTQPPGSMNAGWYWLRDKAHQAYGQWTFQGLDPNAPATLVFDLLVTNGTNGGSGYSAPVELTLINPASNAEKTLQHVVAQNILFTQEAQNSNGAGYETHGSLAVESGWIDAQGNLTIRMARLPEATTHLAINQNSVGIIQPGVNQELATPSPTQEGSGTTSGGKYLFIEFWNHVSGSGTLPALAIDFPDYRFDPTTGTLSSFNPSQTITLTPKAAGFLGRGTSRSEAAGTGAVSSLITIDQIPYSTEVHVFTGAVDPQAAPNMEETRTVVLKILSVAEDGTISIELDGEVITLVPEQNWKQTIETDFKKGQYNGHLTLTSMLTNYGWQDRAKINVSK
jgi:hypothetical protein